MAAAAGRRLDSIQAARAVAACGVVACHMLGYETKFLSGPPVASPAWQYGMAGVDLYFVISGYVITTICIGRFGQPGAARRFLLQRAVRNLSGVLGLVPGGPGGVHAAGVGASRQRWRPVWRAFT